MCYLLSLSSFNTVQIQVSLCPHIQHMDKGHISWGVLTYSHHCKSSVHQCDKLYMGASQLKNCQVWLFTDHKEAAAYQQPLKDMESQVDRKNERMCP